MKHCLTLLIGFMLFCSCHSCSAKAEKTQPATEAEWQQRAMEEARRADNLRIVLISLSVLYFVVYIMGRRRLMRKIWKHNSQLQAALTSADESNRMKAAFMRNMSHEIRTPLNAINGFSQMLCDPDMEFSAEEKENMKQSISENVQNITIIINELLELAKEESEVNPSMFEKVHVNELCQLVLDQAKANNTNNIKLLFHSDLQDSYTVKSEPKILKQIVSQLVANSFLYTPTGHVAIFCEKDNNRLHIRIEDTGVGVPENRRDHLFDSFVTMDDFKSGLGLKLATCRRLAQALSGDLIYDRTFSPGTRFTIDLPA